ncbi:pyocin knob domain-containing protein [Paenibacillus sp. DMB20]|uniref:pyocin knob domain-containing protein n=1 Tax=Paenibacillus sp. DMB20 TaxID=1642570 RepID=UPI00069A21C2|nr:pyocin knob domain-containing protein [Paenibacillus sp. DMB20]
MANPKTPNIGLNKIDRSSPATTYFDLEKYIDQNADTIDQFAGKVNAAIEDTSQRLDTEKHQEVVLQPGMQILNAERSAPFSLSGIKGRTLVNLAGRLGKADDPSKLVQYQITAVADSGASKVTLKATTGALAVRPMKYLAGKKYILLGEVKNGNTTEEIFVQAAGVTSIDMVSLIKSSDSSNFVTVATKFSSTTDVVGSIEVVFRGAVDQYAWVKNLRAYEISAEEYTALDSMSPEQIVSKYPYVDSVQPVRNPYAIRYGENLLPPFYEWVAQGTTRVLSKYEVEISSTTNNVSALEYDVPVIPNSNYTLSIDQNGSSMSVTGGADGIAIVNNTAVASITFNSGNRNTVRVYVSNYAEGQSTPRVGNFIFKNPMLTIGSTPKPFKPREDSMLALQTDLYADPITSENADEVIERNGQYFKLAKWKRKVLDGSLDWAFNNSVTGVKRIGAPITLNWFPFTSGTGFATKYDGKMLTISTTVDVSAPSDSFTLWDNNYVYLDISSADSGWGDSYHPTPYEIKAYFWGWKMFDSKSNPDGTGVYNRTDGLYKGWARRISEGTFVEGTSQLPTIIAPQFTPYQLVYQLATPTVESIDSEGMLTFNEGDNQIEVGTGIVIRERAKPTHYSPNGNYYINNKELSGSLLKNKVSLMLRVYRNGQVDNTAKIENDANAYGKQHVRFLPSDFDQTAAYSVTYLMPDKLLVVPFIGSYATNEKAMLQELTDAVQQNATATSSIVSALELIAGAGAAKEAETNVKKYVDSKPWQKAALTRDDWKNIDLPPGFDLNTLVKNGFYNGFKLKNAPTLEGEDRWIYIEVQCHTNGDGYVLQRVSKLNSGVNAFYQRTKENGVWYPWSPDLFTSVANGKQAIASAISDKGVPASGSDEFAVLASKVGQISTGSTSLVSTSFSDVPLSSVYTRELLTIPGGRNTASIFSIEADNKTSLNKHTIYISCNSIGYQYLENNNYQEVSLYLVDSSGQRAVLGADRIVGKGTFNNPSTTLTISALQLDRTSRQIVFTGFNNGGNVKTVTLPSNFRTQDPLKLIAEFSINYPPTVDHRCSGAVNKAYVVVF